MIQHVIVLMLENRSFDHMLGFLDHPSPKFTHLDPLSPPTNPDPSQPSAPPTPASNDGTPNLSIEPPHSHASVMEQIDKPLFGKPKMDGFISAYIRAATAPHASSWRWGHIAGTVVGTSIVAGVVLALAGAPLMIASVATGGVSAIAIVGAAIASRHRRPPKGTVASGPMIMRCLDPPTHLPVLATLAKEFAVCTAWHCSVPGATWPNRNFAHAATSDGTVDIEAGLYTNTTIFERLGTNGHHWGIFSDGVAQVWAFRRLWDSEPGGEWGDIESLLDHISSSTLPNYAFVEPLHSGAGSNSQHPADNLSGPADFKRGEKLMARIYEALRANPEVFEKTAFVVTYDEHGGLFDHVPPSTDATPPGATLDSEHKVPFTRRLVGFYRHVSTSRFDFKLLGPRVPTVVVSPLIERGRVCGRLYDHSSIVATLRTLFPGGDKPLPPLTNRDRDAQTFEHLFSLSTPRADLPNLRDFAIEPDPVDMMFDATAPRTDEFAIQLEQLAERVLQELPPAAVGVGPADVTTTSADAIARFRQHTAQA